MSFCLSRHLSPELQGIPWFLSYWVLLTFKYFLLRGQGARGRKEQIKTNQNKSPSPKEGGAPTLHSHTKRSPLKVATWQETARLNSPPPSRSSVPFLVNAKQRWVAPLSSRSETKGLPERKKDGQWEWAPYILGPGGQASLRPGPIS